MVQFAMKMCGGGARAGDTNSTCAGAEGCCPARHPVPAADIHVGKKTS